MVSVAAGSAYMVRSSGAAADSAKTETQDWKRRKDKVYGAGGSLAQGTETSRGGEYGTF